MEQLSAAGDGHPLGHVAPLTGLRAVAIALVVVFLVAGGGGWIGLEVFFVLSGFLITASLVETPTLRRFYLRRLVRLAPAYLVLLAVLACYARLAHPAEFASWRGELLAALTLHSNLYDIGHVQHPGVATAWTLCTEAQFYVVWGALLVVGLRLLSRRTLLIVTSLGAVASVVDGIVLAAHHAGYERLLVAPDTNAAALLIGSALALAVTAGYLDRFAGGRGARLVPVGVVAVLVVWSAAVTGRHGWQFAGPTQLVALAAGAAIACLALAPDGLLGRLLTDRRVRWVGLLSYSLYLWSQFAVHAGPRLRPGLEGHAIHYGVALLLLVELPIVSYYLIERRAPRLFRTRRTAPPPPMEEPASDTDLFAVLVDMDASAAPQPLESHR